jgi:hypothetical protein
MTIVFPAQAGIQAKHIVFPAQAGTQAAFSASKPYRLPGASRDPD